MAWTSVWGVEKLHFDIIPPIRGHRNMPWERKSADTTYESRIRSSATAHTVLQEYMDGADREMFVVMLLDRKNGVIGLNTVSVGSLSASVVHPRECFKPAILSNASSMLLSHNHPSGDPFP